MVNQLIDRGRFISPTLLILSLYEVRLTGVGRFIIQRMNTPKLARRR
jgi:hypothetical protein